jgi:Protein of unknown function (DUF3617)
MKTVNRLCIVLVSVSMAAAALAQAPALAVKMGLWEVTTSTQIGAQMPAFDTSKLTPEQKAKVEAMMKSMLAAHTRTTQICMTPERFEKSTFLIDEEPGSTCKQTLTTNSKSTLDSTVECTGEHSTTAQMHIDAQSPTSVEGTIQSVNGAGSKTLKVDVKLTGKWLAADCKDTD